MPWLAGTRTPLPSGPTSSCCKLQRPVTELRQVCTRLCFCGAQASMCEWFSFACGLAYGQPPSSLSFVVPRFVAGIVTTPLAAQHIPIPAAQRRGSASGRLLIVCLAVELYNTHTHTHAFTRRETHAYNSLPLAHSYSCSLTPPSFQTLRLVCTSSPTPSAWVARPQTGRPTSAAPVCPARPRQAVPTRRHHPGGHGARCHGRPPPRHPPQANLRSVGPGLGW